MILSIVQTKGGVCKTTLAQTLASSKVFGQRFASIGLVDLDAQGTLREVIKLRRDAGRLPASVDCVSVSGSMPAKAVQEIAARFDLVILDVPGEGQAKLLTRFAVAASDVILIPTRSSFHDEQSLADNLWPFIEEQAQEALGAVLVLPVFTHPQSNPKSHTDYFRAILPPPMTPIGPPLSHRPGVFENFNREGLSLREYCDSVKGNQRLHRAAERARDEVEAIAKEILRHAD